MKILVVDDEHSFGQLLGRALHKLGHTAQIVSHPDDALAAFAAETFDAVITDIDMPGMHGVALARSLRTQRASLPIAFCTGSSSKDELVQEAETLGRVMPKIWTVADVRELVNELGELGEALARGSHHKIARLEPRAVANQPGACPPLVSKQNPASRPSPRKIKLTCRDWAQVAKLCDDQGSRARRLTLRGEHKLRDGEKLMIALRLPDELVLSIVAEVSSVRTDPVDGESIFAVEMLGLTPELCTRLRSMAQSQGVLVGGQPYSRRLARGSSPEAVRVSEDDSATGESAVLGNLRLRRQIDQLGKKLKQ